MVAKKFSLIAAACENMGIGINGDLPWRLKYVRIPHNSANECSRKILIKTFNRSCFLPPRRNELAYFNRMTTATRDPAKRNACIMGRNTYVGIPPSHRPLPQRLNIVLSRTASASDFPADVLVCASLGEAMRLLHERYANEVESVWIAGGTSVYREAMESELCHRIYFTEIRAHFECDTFFPPIDATQFRLLPANDGGVPDEEQEEKGIRYQYKIYEKIAPVF